MDYFVHPTADVHAKDIGTGSRIWQFVVVLAGARIGRDANICSHCFIENDVVIGDKVTVKSGVQLWDGIRLGEDVFIGPNVTFTNDKFPRSKHHQAIVATTDVQDGASIGAGATILPGVTIGRHSMVGAGSVVTRSVPPYAIAVGNPARIRGYVDTQNTMSGTRKAESESPATLVAGVKLVRLPRIEDIRGSLTVGEFQRTVPFEAKRYFMVFDVPTAETRGEHAHRTCEQFLICARGSVSVVADDGKHRSEVLLNRPELGLYLPPMTWGIQYRYSPDSVLLVFASHYYDAADYIRNYDEFLRESRSRP